MKCFIASAFDRHDVDDVYDNGVCPVLDMLDLKPLRIDRVEHNENIDTHIIDLIKQSQVAIADLTYARPSVYYEAGYASALGMPVVYIAHQDHLSPTSENDELKIHFDLKMKNIIKWSLPLDEDFKSKLFCRLKMVLKPLIKKVEKIESMRKEERLFDSRSEHHKMQDILEEGTRILCSCAYKQNELLPGLYYTKDPFYRQFYRNIGGKLYQIHLIVRSVVNKSALKWLPFYFLRISNKENEEAVNLLIVASLNPSTPKTLARLLPEWTPAAPKTFNRNRPNLPHQQIVFIDNVKSIEDFYRRLKSLIDTS